MSRVITFSRVFPVTHPRKGEPTHFVEKIWKSFFNEGGGTPDSFYDHITDYTLLINSQKPIGNIAFPNKIDAKFHTIRAGNRWKVGDKFSPRVWSGKPYSSKQIAIAPDIEIKKIWEFECKSDGLFYINSKWVDVTSSEIPQNDGLSSDDMLAWFPANKPFKGQIICWNESIEY